MNPPLESAKYNDDTLLIKVSARRCVQGLYSLTSAQQASAGVNSAHVHSDDMVPSLLPCAGVKPGSCLAPGGETDGSSSCRSEHKAPERSLQSVVPVLIIDENKTLPRYRAG
ncbi:hypothetical protein VZT92_007712 [Zoarces viviparus]|uniref:Uncharacterized protein n=1 Tax=Zoarces viviparus TaxID=48416 RepID=A0AAW1FKY6_ZOAVI